MNSKPFFIVLGTVSLLVAGPLAFAAGDGVSGKSSSRPHAMPVADTTGNQGNMNQQNTTSDQQPKKKTTKKKQPKEGTTKTRQQGENPASPTDTGPGLSPPPGGSGNVGPGGQGSAPGSSGK